MYDFPNTTAGAGASLATRRRKRRRSHAARAFATSVRMTGGTSPPLRHQRSVPPFDSDPELHDAITAIEQLAAIAHIRTREYDDKLDAIERHAGPWALAFLGEIQRLETLLRRGYARTVSGARRTLLSGWRRRRSAGGHYA